MIRITVEYFSVTKVPWILKIQTPLALFWPSNVRALFVLNTKFAAQYTAGTKIKFDKSVDVNVRVHVAVDAVVYAKSKSLLHSNAEEEDT